MCLRDGALVEGGDAEYPASQLLPPGALARDERETFLVLPLAFEDQLFGVIAFNYAEGINAYAAFRNEIAAALKTIRLREELVRATMLHERSVQERLATTKRMEALSVLAGGVAHDLNNALGPLIALPDIILAQLGDVGRDAQAVRDVRADVEAIKAASQRAAQTIKDLLTLGRQGRMAKENLDLNRIIKACWANGALAFGADATSGVKLRADVGRTPLLVRGAEAQLGRAIDNLVRNAVEALGGAGEVIVKCAKVDVLEPRTALETIPPGRYAVLSVSDDGCGIQPHELGRVFEPFFATKRAKDNSGVGGSGLRHRPWRRQGARRLHRRRQPARRGTTVSLYFPLAEGALPH